MNNSPKNMGDVPSRFLKSLTIEDQLDAILDMKPENRAKLERAIKISLGNAVNNGNEEERATAQEITTMI